MTARDYAVNAAATLCEVFQASSTEYALANVANVIEKAIRDAAPEHEAIEGHSKNAEYARLCELVASSPAVIYSYEAKSRGELPTDLRWTEHQNFAWLRN